MTDVPATSSAAPVLAAAALLYAGSLAFFWPGIPLYDSVAQYSQAISNTYDDWHPPAMARLWAVLHAIFGGGTGPMLAVQMLAYWTGFGLFAGALVTTGRRWAGWALLVVAAWPPFLGWQAVVLKDAQLTGAMLAAAGLAGWWRLRHRQIPVAVWGGVVALLGYAVLVRANAVFAVVPMVVMLPRDWRPLVRLGVALAGIVAVLTLAGPINHGLLRANRSGVERTEAIYDLAGIAVRLPEAIAPSVDAMFDRAALATLIARHCVKPFFWDPLGEPARCDSVVEPLRHVPPGTLYMTLLRAILAHPFVYAAHRLAHLNSTDRWLVPAALPSAAPPFIGESNDLGLTGPGPLTVGFQRLAGRLVDTPPAWPVGWIVVAATAWLVALRRLRDPARDLALALATSALALEGSFVVLSIASDLRYHLWPMIAAAVAVLLLMDGKRVGEQHRWLTGGGVLTIVIAAAAVARLSLPAPPPSYVGMLVW
ncbi:hypothetical protein [Sphingomonas bacterium]|uniref:hypothetical protein n=1 Tax=Sphingomonas bacterium TaxID=1895847 RepID=UPI00157679FA|nr:hypothetical protein [Sphingomonas bacterium]